MASAILPALLEPRFSAALAAFGVHSKAATQAVDGTTVRASSSKDAIVFTLPRTLRKGGKAILIFTVERASGLILAADISLPHWALRKQFLGFQSAIDSLRELRADRELPDGALPVLIMGLAPSGCKDVDQPMREDLRSMPNVRGLPSLPVKRYGEHLRSHFGQSFGPFRFKSAWPAPDMVTTTNLGRKRLLLTLCEAEQLLKAEVSSHNHQILARLREYGLLEELGVEKGSMTRALLKVANVGRFLT